MLDQVRLCAVRPLENWLGSSLNQIQGWMTGNMLLSCFRKRMSDNRLDAATDLFHKISPWLLRSIRSGCC